MKKCIMLGIVFTAACAGESVVPTAEVVTESKRIPAVSALPNCDQAVQSVPTLCEWIAGTDALVTGLVQSIEPVFFPAYVMWEDAPRSSCEATVEPAMKITLMVEKTLHGDPMDTVEIFVGREQRLRFDPQPNLHENTFKWSGPQGIEPGQRLGFGLVRSGEIWTPNHRDFFEVYDDAVAFQTQSETGCTGLSPIEINGLTLNAVEERIAVCDFSNPDLGKNLKHLDMPATIQQQSMGLCWDDSPAPQAECILHVDCSVGQLCVNELCVSE